MAGGIVITGGGAQLACIKQLFELLTGMDARIGHPNEYLGKSKNEAAKSPMYATPIGLVLAGFRAAHNREKAVSSNKQQSKATPGTDKRGSTPSPKTEGSRTDFFKKILDRTKGFLVDDIGEGKDY